MHLANNLMAKLAELFSDSLRLILQIWARLNNKHHHTDSIGNTEKVSVVFLRIIFKYRNRSNIMCLAESHATVARRWKILQYEEYFSVSISYYERLKPAIPSNNEKNRWAGPHRLSVWTALVVLPHPFLPDHWGVSEDEKESLKLAVNTLRFQDLQADCYVTPAPTGVINVKAGERYRFCPPGSWLPSRRLTNKHVTPIKARMPVDLPPLWGARSLSGTLEYYRCNQLRF